MKRQESRTTLSESHIPLLKACCWTQHTSVTRQTASISNSLNNNILVYIVHLIRCCFTTSYKVKHINNVKMLDRQTCHCLTISHISSMNNSNPHLPPKTTTLDKKMRCRPHNCRSNWTTSAYKQARDVCLSGDTTQCDMMTVMYVHIVAITQMCISEKNYCTHCRRLCSEFLTHLSHQLSQIYQRNIQELSNRKQTACQLCTQYIKGIYNNPVTLKPRLRVTQGHWKWNG